MELEILDIKEYVVNICMYRIGLGASSLLERGVSANWFLAISFVFDNFVYSNFLYM